MNAINVFGYKTSLNEKARVSLNREGHSEHSHSGIILRALENPSKRREHQWYDVRFDSGVRGRFLERYLEPVSEAVGKGVEGSHASVA